MDGMRTILWPKCTRLWDVAYTISIFSVGDAPEPCRSAPGAWTRNQFPRGSPAFPLLPFYETTSVMQYNVVTIWLIRIFVHHSYNTVSVVRNLVLLISVVW